MVDKSNSSRSVPVVSARDFSVPAKSKARAEQQSEDGTQRVRTAVTSASLSSKAKRRLEVKLAEARLQRVRQEEELRLKQLQAEEELRLKQLQLESERALLQAEADVTEANLIADASSTCSDLSVPESVAPRLSAHEKVMEYLHNIPTNERQGQSRKENDLQRESPAVTYALREDKAEIRGRRFSELSLGPMPHQLCPPPVVRNSGRFQGPAVRVVGPAKTSEVAADNPSGNGASRSSGELNCNVNDLAKMLVRCRGSETTLDSDRFDGNPLDYYQFLRQVEDRILNVYGQSDPGHALHLLLDATKGRAHKLISSCVMLSPDIALNEALRLLHKAFGSPQVAVRAFIDSVCEGGVISHTEVGLEDFYSGLINCKIVLEAAGAGNLLNAASTAERIFMRLPHNLQKGFAKLALDRGFDMDVVPFELFIEYIDQEHRLLCSRFGRLLKSSRSKITTKGCKARANVVQSSKDNDHRIVTKRPSNVETLPRCNYCNTLGHQVGRCEVFQKLSFANRKEFVQHKRLCFNCLGKGHGVKYCSSKIRCRKCDGKHHTLMHRYDEEGSSESSDSAASAKDTSSPPVDATASSAQDISQAKGMRTRLQVIPVCVINQITGTCKDTLALLDSGADCHLMAKDLCTSLGLSGTSTVSEIQLANGVVEKYDSSLVECAIRGISEEETFRLEEVRVVPRMPDLSGSIPSQQDIMSNPHLTGLEIPSVASNKTVQLIIGINPPALHVFSEIRQDGDSSLWAGKTPLGWVLHGRNSAGHNNSCCRVNLLVDARAESALNSVCPCHFDYGDQCGDPDELLPSLDDEEAERQMKDSCELVEGRFQVRIPWKKGCPCLPNNYQMALSRLRSLGRRLVRDKELFIKYRDKIHELIALGHAIELPEWADCDRNAWFIPHHCTKGKFRIVFDCAARFKGTSLNEQILQGPDNANNLVGVLTRFRRYPIALVGDIRAMFHSVKVDPRDQSALRFLWWEDDDISKPPKVYQLTVHCFGLTSSPSVAGFALRRTADENLAGSTPDAVQAVKRNIYVDDLLKSVPNSQSAVALAHDVISLLEGGGLSLPSFLVIALLYLSRYHQTAWHHT